MGITVCVTSTTTCRRWKKYVLTLEDFSSYFYFYTAVSNWRRHYGFPPNMYDSLRPIAFRWPPNVSSDVDNYIAIVNHAVPFAFRWNQSVVSASHHFGNACRQSSVSGLYGILCYKVYLIIIFCSVFKSWMWWWQHAP